ncbi:hypothetical protein Tco_0867002, partial [Tanacetum coccineum]
MLKICPKIPGQKFEDPPLEEQILSFIRDLRHTSEINFLSDVNVNHMRQPWRSFSAIINKCLSGKTTALESLCLSRAQILWGMYHNKNVDYVYLLWEDLSEAYKTYHAYATREKIPKTKYVKNKVDPESSPKKKSAQASKGKRIKTSTKVAKPIKLATKRSLIQTHGSHASGLGADEGTGVIPGVPDVPTYNSDDEQISWKSSNEDDDDEVNVSEDDDNQNDDDADNVDDDEVNVSEDDDNQNDDDADNVDDDEVNTESDNDDDDLVHPKLSTFDEKERQDEEDKEEEWSDDEAYDDETQGVNVEREELDEEQTNEEEEANELYMDVNVNLEGRDTEMTDAPHTNIQSTQVTEDTHVIITAATPEGQQQSSSVSSGFISNMLNPNLDTGIDSILNLNTESTSLVDDPVSTNVEMPPLSVTPVPPPPIPFIQPQQQTPVPTP